MGINHATISGPKEAVIDRREDCALAQSPIDQILAGRFACREFCNAPVRDRRSSRSSGSRGLRPAVRTSSPGTSTCWLARPRQSLDGAAGCAPKLPRRAHIGIQILRQRLTRSVPQTATRIRTTVLWSARNCSNRSRGEEQTNRQELHILRRAGGIDRDDRPSAGSRKLARPWNVRAERDACGGSTRASVLSAGDVREISPNFAPPAVNPGGADGGVRHLDREGQRRGTGNIDATGGY